MKKSILIISSLLLALGAVIAISFVDFDEYYIERSASEEVIQKHLQNWLNRGDLRDEELLVPSIKKYIQVDDTDTYIALFQLENRDVGYAKLKVGWNDKLKIVNSSYGSNTISYRPFKTNKGTYGLMMGKNPENKIAYIEKYYKGFDYKVKIGAGDTFLSVHPVPNDSLTVDDWSNFTLYDTNHQKIDLRTIEELARNTPAKPASK